jgi:hypothetical protein
MKHFPLSHVKVLYKMGGLFKDSQQTDCKFALKIQGNIRVKIYNTISEYLGSE